MAFAGVGAHVDESQVARLVVVDGARLSASDSNPGTDSLPFKTVTRAAQVALANSAAGLATKVRIGPGIYRESVSLAGGAGTAPIILEASEPRNTVISGSDIWTGWSGSPNAAVYVHAWPYRWGPAPYPAGWQAFVTLADIVRRREMIFVNSVPLTQTIDCGNLAPGSFCVSEAAALVYVNPPQGVALESATVEVAVRSTLLTVFARQNIVLRGLVFQHDVSPLQGGAAVQVTNSSNVTIDNCAFLENNYTGLALVNVSALTVSHSDADRNGVVGIAAWKLSQTLFDGSGASHNNWRGLMGGFTDWDPCGMKMVLVRDSVVNQFRAIGNSARGLWLDTDDNGVTITGATIQNNLTDGLFFEAAQGPISVDSSSITGNSGNGILVGNALAVTLTNSTVWNNGASQIMVSGVPGGRAIQPYDGAGQNLLSQGWTLRNDFIGTSFPNQNALLATTLPQYDWNLFVQTAKSDGNTWYQPDATKAFQVAGGLTLSLAQWVAATGLDAKSQSGTPSLFAITPSKATVASGKSVPFTALLSGVPASRVTYTLEPALGTVSPQGVYSAPASVNDGTTVAITAANLDPPFLTATASVTLAQAASALVRVNAAGPTYVDTMGQAWAADDGANFYWNDSTVFHGNPYSTSAPIAGTPDPVLYQSQRWSPGTLSYRIALPNGTYTVVLHFAELIFTAPGQRVFDIAVNGSTEVVGFDSVLRSGGRNIAVDLSIDATVTNGGLNLSLLPVIDNPAINALEIIPRL